VTNLVKVSVIIPTYDRAHLLHRSIQSALNQTCKDLEVLIVDDGSTDETFDAVKPFFRYPQVRYLRHETNKGHQAARNTGIKNARGEYIAFLDSDDTWIPQKIELQLDAILKRGDDYVVLSLFVEQRDGLETRRFEREYEGYVYPEMLASDGPAYGSMLVPREGLLRIGLLDESIVAFADWDTCISLSRLFRFTTVNQKCVNYYKDEPDSITTNALAKAFAYQYIVEKNQDEMLRVIGRSGLARHFKNIALISDDAGDFNRCRTYMLKAVREDIRDPTIFLFALWTLFGGQVFHVRKPAGAIQKRIASKLARLGDHKQRSF